MKRQNEKEEMENNQGASEEYIHDFCKNMHAQLCSTFCEPMNGSMKGLLVHHQLPESTHNHVHWVGDAIQPSHPLSPPFPPVLNFSPASGSFPMSQLFTSRGQSIGISASNEYSGLISFRIDWFDLLAVQGTLKTLLQHHSSPEPPGF